MSDSINPDTEQDRTGQTLGDFQLLRRLGQGGMGQVYLAEQISLKRKVAIKLLRPDLAANETSLQRFKTEAEAVARATHSNIVQVYAIGEVDGVHFMALEYVDGRNLREYVEKKGPPELMVSMSIIRQVAAALQRASELGVIHRDIKPENILLTRKCEVKVADFGLSRIFADDAKQLSLTQSGVSMGTPLYMSPEQVEGNPVDPRTDIYSLGVTCYHMLAGHPPFRGSTPFEVAVQHVRSDPAPLQEIRSDLPEQLCAIVHKMMAKDPDQRFQTAREIIQAINTLRNESVGMTTSAVTPASQTMTLAPNSRKPGVSTQEMQPPRKSRLRWWVLTSLAVAFGGGLFLGFLRFQANEKSIDSAKKPTTRAKQDPPPKTTVAPIPPLSSKNERERFLVKIVDENLKGEKNFDIWTSLKYSKELALLYLKDRKLKQAEQLLAKMAKAAGDRGGNRAKHPYSILAQVGNAMVFAFKNKPTESLELFQLVLVKPQDKKSRMLQIWRDDPALRKMIADAMEFNFQNAPNEVRQSGLNRYRFPPGDVFRDKWKGDSK